MVQYPSVMPPKSMGEALSPLKDLSATEFAKLLSAVSGPHSFSLSKGELEALEKDLPRQATNLTFFLAVLSFLHEQVTQVIDSGLPFSDAIEAAVEELDDQAKWGENKDEVIKRLTLLFQNEETHQRYRKLKRLQSGFVPNALSFSTFVDLRPDFGDDDELELKGYLPVIQFRIITDAAGQEARRVVFQVTEDALIELKKSIERTEAKMKLLRDQPSLALQLIKI